ncbi:hypothetical protein BBD42_21520 [Paenibacillus sp. BIHB 4019]|uniref:HTH cro/C1-type domain-containing protein n=1 Tax=Paenibacillus sp. BIHB 4019 TaxID=1870819 RepID=A0A1B2DM20_9BACL|nr:hypothetical protein BBD42_21520 [Paenibacillus sp. BIHB 4019]
MERESREDYRIKRIMKYIRLRELSDLLDCHLATVSHYENGRYNLSKENEEKYKNYIDSHQGRKQS